jgi:hypothetical protein
MNKKIFTNFQNVTNFYVTTALLLKNQIVFYMLTIEVSLSMGVLKSHFLTTRWRKPFFSAQNRFFWVNNPRELNQFVSTTVVFSVVLKM